MSKHLLTAIAVVVCVWASASACSDSSNEASGCNPETDDYCFCFDSDTEAQCTRGSAGCVCSEYRDSFECLHHATDGTAQPLSCVEEDACTGVVCEAGQVCDPSNGQCTGDLLGWRFVMLEDQTSPVSGEFPGADVDAVEVIDADGTSHFATTVEDFNLGSGSALDTAQILGAPDSNCDANSGAFVALGGQDAGGYIIVGFSTASEPVGFGAGSSIVAHELGSSMCGQFDDDPYVVSVSVSTDRETFTQVGTATGMTSVPVTIDP